MLLRFLGWPSIKINPFPHTKILQQTTLNIYCPKIENLYNWMDNLWLKVGNIVALGAIASFVTMFPKCHLPERRQKASIWGKGLMKLFWYIEKHGCQGSDLVFFIHVSMNSEHFKNLLVQKYKPYFRWLSNKIGEIFPNPLINMIIRERCLFSLYV